MCRYTSDCTALAGRSGGCRLRGQAVCSAGSGSGRCPSSMQSQVIALSYFRIISHPLPAKPRFHRYSLVAVCRHRRRKIPMLG